MGGCVNTWAFENQTAVRIVISCATQYNDVLREGEHWGENTPNT